MKKILEKYKKIWKIIYNYKWLRINHKKKKYLNILFLFIIFYIIEYSYININKLSSYVMIFWTTFIIIILYVYNEDYKNRIKSRNINLHDNICNKLIYKNAKKS